MNSGKMYWFVFIIFPGALLGAPRIGDAGSVFDAGKYDGRFPDMKEWAKAGVEGGIPPRSESLVATRVKPGESIQEAVDRAGSGVVLVLNGIHTVKRTINVPSNVIVRGETRDGTILETGSKNTPIISLQGVSYAALEDLTVRNTAIMAMDSNSYIGKYANFNDIPKRSPTILLKNARNCWIQNCRVLFSPSFPISLLGSSHNTLRDNLIDKSANKGGDGNGYYNIENASNYNLLYNETVRNLRHISVWHDSKYNVLTHLDTKVDINFHSRDGGHNLIEANSIYLHSFHGWKPIEDGNASEHEPPGPENLIYKNQGSLAKRSGVFPHDPEGTAVYTVRDNWKDFKNSNDLVILYDDEPPLAKTLYAVTGEHSPFKPVPVVFSPGHDVKFTPLGEANATWRTDRLTGTSALIPASGADLLDGNWGGFAGGRPPAKGVYILRSTSGRKTVQSRLLLVR